MNENTLAPEQEQQVVPETTLADVTVVDDDNNEAGHKVLFFVIMGIVCLSGIGIPVAAIIIWRQHKKLTQYKDQFGDLPKEQATEAAAPTEEKKEDSKTETESK